MLVYLFVCLHVCMFGEGDFALKALRNDMGFRHETLHGVKWGGGVGVKLALFSVTYLLNVPISSKRPNAPIKAQCFQVSWQA